ncbi:MAG: small multi-drug export protein [Thermoplasmatales archaeon]|nr:small multi-drug export protein [Thermoplasmatales archaeon]
MRVESKPLIRLAKFFVPFIIGFGVIGTIGLIIEENLRIKYWPLVTGYFFPPLGKETIIPSGVLVGIDPILMALSIAFVDIIVALFLIWNYNLAKKIPLIGKFMIKVEEKGKNVEEKYGWIKPLRFIGIMLFVMIPFQGSGGMVGSIVGRLVGMKPWNTFFAISLGAVIGCLLIAMFSQAFLIFAEINTTLTLILVGIIAIVIIAYVVIKRLRKK